MAVTIGQELRAALRSGETLVLQVRSVQGAEALSALRAARGDIAALDGGWKSAPGLRPGDRNGPKYLSPPVPLPDGPLMMIDFGFTPPELLSTVPELVQRRLVEAGVRDASLTLADEISDRYLAAWEFAPVARAYLRGPLGTPLGTAQRPPPDWLANLALDWLRHEQPDSSPLGVVLSAEFPLDWDTAPEAAAAVLGAGVGFAAVASDFRTTLAAVSVAGSFRDTVPEASLTAGGPVADRMRGQRDFVRAHAETLIWAGIQAAADAQYLLSAGYLDRDGSQQVADLLVPDAMWWQLLSPSHLDRLGGPPPGALPLADGRMELTVGEPEQWLPDHPDREAVRAQARELLAGCLLGPDAVLELIRERMRTSRERDATFFRHR